MDDRHGSDRPQRAEGSDAGREGFGDDMGTRVGRPDPARGAQASNGPSSQPVKEGLEGAIFEEDATASDAHRGSSADADTTGAGSEAAAGIRGAADQVPRSTDDGGADDDLPGSEPLEKREQEHKSGYGGEGGEPRVSSDQRE